MSASLPINVLQTSFIISLTGPRSGLFPKHAMLPPTTNSREAYGTQGANAHRGRGECTEEIGEFPHGAPPGVQRAQMVWASAQGGTVPIIARQAELSAFQVCAWIHRFHQHGLAGLADAPRAGRPRRHDETIRGKVIALARTKLPYGWSAKRHDTRGKVRGDASKGVQDEGQLAAVSTAEHQRCPVWARQRGSALRRPPAGTHTAVTAGSKPAGANNRTTPTDA
jgi:transposase